MAPAPLSRTERRRRETAAEIAAIGMAQVAAGGVSALSLTAIARRMGMSGPAIYRYFASRDRLLGRLVADVFDDLADAVSLALGAAPAATAEDRLRTVARAYRSWALEHRREYVLLTAGLPHLQQRDDLDAATDRALALITQTVLALRPPAQRDDPPPAWLVPFGVVIWQRMHGHLALELEGIHAAMRLPSAALFEQEVETLIAEARARMARPARPAPPLLRGGRPRPSSSAPPRRR